MNKIDKKSCFYIILLVLLIISFVMLFNSDLIALIEELDDIVISFTNGIINDYFTIIFKLFTFLGDFYIPITIIVYIYLFFKNKLYSYILASSYLFSGIVAFGIKYLVSRPRPIEALIKIPSSYSFPSGHTITASVFYLILCYLLTIKLSKTVKLLSSILAILFVLCIGISRIYLKVHFFSDVLGGLFIGGLCVIFIINIVEKNYKERL